MLDQHVFTFRPTSYTANEQKTLWTVRDAYFKVVGCDVRIEQGFSGGTPLMSVGTVADPSLLAGTGDITIGTPGVYPGSALGELIAPGTAVIVNYTAHASATQGLARVAITGYRVGV